MLEELTGVRYLEGEGWGEVDSSSDTGLAHPELQRPPCYNHLI